MNPNNRGPEEYDHDDAERRDGSPRSARGDAGDGGPQRPAVARTVQLVAGEYLLTVNPVDGSEIEPCPPGEHPGRPGRRGPEERDAQRRAALPPEPVGPAAPGPQPLMERGGQRERLVRLLSRGRSVRVTGPSGSGRSALLDAVAANCAEFAPDGIVRLSGYRRTPTDVLYELFAAVYDAPLHRPDRAELLTAVHEIGAVVVLDDIEFGGSALDEILAATPECAFLISATPDVAAPSPDSHLEEVFLPGLSRATCVELLEEAVQRPLTEDETSWAGDLWFESEGLPLRFVQAGALLRQRDALRAGAEAFEEHGVFAEQPYEPSDVPHEAPREANFGEDGRDAPLPSLGQAAAPAPLLASRLSEAARETLRFALALGGACPHQAHLPALAGDTHADAAVGELLGCGLLSPVGAHYRLAAGVSAQLEAADAYGEDTEARAQSAAQHYAWWAGHPSVAPERVAAEADAILAAMCVVVAQGEAGRQSAAVLLARTVAPAFAAAGRWGAWERALRHGQEAARVAGEVAEEAYFHHELGVLALCTGNLDRARAELEASIGLRGALSDRRGTVAGRRALALVADRGGFAPGAGSTAAGEETPGGGTDLSASPPGGVRAVLARLQADEADTVVTPRRPGSPGLRRTVLGGARRNKVAAGAGALLAVVLGTVVTLGAMSGDDGGPSDRVRSGQTADEDDGNNGLIADETPTQGATSRPQKPGGTTAPGPSVSPGTGGGDAPSGEPSDSGEPSESKPGETDDPEPTRPPSPTKTTSKPTKPPSSTPGSPTPSTSGSPSSTSDPTPPGGDTSDSASGTAPVTTGAPVSGAAAPETLPLT
ncbi:ATP-binding protein [Streptomyces sp. 7N604]|uniref:ATP-binding protein n=1 Tax=Streptomyces sp. 7N604 TaxID=3457415 RepID=UPI003FD69D43